MTQIFENKVTPAIFFGVLQSSIVTAKDVHWQTSSYAEHKTMEEYYNDMSSILDKLVETYFGMLGKKFEIVTPKSGFVNSKAMIATLTNYVNSNRIIFKEYSCIQNIIDEVLQIIYQTNYRLTLS